MLNVYRRDFHRVDLTEILFGLFSNENIVDDWLLLFVLKLKYDAVAAAVLLNRLEAT